MGLVCAPTLAAEAALWRRGRAAIGVDEVGRGAIAGPVVVGAVRVGPRTSFPRGLRDSKLLSANRREELVGPIRDWADGWSVGAASVAEISTWGIRGALALAIDRALLTLAANAALLIDGPLDLLAPSSVDGRWPTLVHRDIERTAVVGGDQSCATIAAASVLAKVHRDRLMTQLAQRFPQFEWQQNKGYGTAGHRSSVDDFGPSPLHRLGWGAAGA